MKYNPNMSHFVETAEDRWGNPEENLENLIKYGVPVLDMHLRGVHDNIGELILFIGEEKRRKTTLVVNLVINLMQSEYNNRRLKTVIETLESGMPPDTYADTIITNMASRYLMRKGHKPHGACPLCQGKCSQLEINVDFLYLNKRSKEQKEALQYALDTTHSWPIKYYGPSSQEGDSRNLYSVFDPDGGRLTELVEDGEIELLVVDHSQQYDIGIQDATIYDIQSKVIKAAGTFTAKYKTVTWLISQVSLSSLKEFKSGGKIRSKGGKEGHEESNAIVSTSYDVGSGILGINIEDSRRGGLGTESYSIDDVSGAFADEKIWRLLYA